VYQGKAFMYCLIVEDNKISREVYSAHIERIGFESHVTMDGETALASCIEKMPDVILLDWHMPYMDGLTFVQELHKLPTGRDPLIIMCTCDEGSPKSPEFLAEGIKDYLIKPTRFEDLKDTFERLEII